MAQIKPTFSFGKNWKSFVAAHFTEERVEISKQHILEFLQLENLNGKYFLDVGCGSGLSSLAALKAGASRVVSFDVDLQSVQATQALRELHGSPSHWEVLQGSALNKEFLKGIEPADVLYSWGVLHHTGSMWEAIENTISLMKDSGVFYIALYTTTPKSEFWINIKKSYNSGGYFRKRYLELWHVKRFIRNTLRDGKNPFRIIRDYKKNRGMEYMTDVRDWLGGWPYEDASVEEVQAFFQQRGWQQINLKTGEANTEYLFVKAPTAG